MFAHAPLDYGCPFCRIIQNIGDAQNFSKQTENIFQNENVTALLAARMIPDNPGHVLIIPNQQTFPPDQRAFYEEKLQPFFTRFYPGIKMYSPLLKSETSFLG